jgi:hypothetical protein
MGIARKSARSTHPTLMWRARGMPVETPAVRP